ncbi:MAG TPA: amidase, partial [Candidatus Marinimicrobia bacterium]|nr:amidase [Candidatus Neomarinimicrobiota bacterium]
NSLTPQKRGVSGRIIELMISGEKNDHPYDLVVSSEYEIREALHPKFLYSSAFTINANSNIQSDEDKITLTGAGWGHGVGLCQIGALGMALSGSSSEEILRHYFSSITITKYYD